MIRLLLLIESANERLPPAELSDIEREITIVSPNLFDKRLYCMLDVREQKEFACIIYMGYKLHIQAIESDALPENKEREKNLVRDIFKQVISYVLSTQLSLTKKFDCTPPYSFSWKKLSQISTEIDAFFCADILYFVRARTYEISDEARKRFLYTKTVPISLMIFGAWFFLEKIFAGQEKMRWFKIVENTLLLALVPVVVGLLHLAEHFYPGGKEFIRFNSYFSGAVYRCMTRGREGASAVQRSGRQTSEHYIKFFRDNPDAAPLNLYELAHKAMSGDYDFLEKKPCADLEKALQFFLDDAVNDDPENCPLFPVQAFLNIPIYTTSLLVNTDWVESDEKVASTSVTDLATTKIETLLKVQGFFEPEARSKKNETQRQPSLA